jgi:tellurite resistance protein
LIPYLLPLPTETDGGCRHFRYDILEIEKINQYNIFIEMKLELNRSQAFMALGIAIISADGKCTAQETETLLKLFKTFKLMTCSSEEECEYSWEHIFDETFSKLKQAFPDRQMSMTEKHLDILMPIIEQAVSPESQESLFHFAVAIAVSDGLDSREKVILDRLQKDFQISLKGDYQALLEKVDVANCSHQPVGSEIWG